VIRRRDSGPMKRQRPGVQPSLAELEIVYRRSLWVGWMTGLPLGAVCLFCAWALPLMPHDRVALVMGAAAFALGFGLGTPLDVRHELRKRRRAEQGT
jgi:hypothetical protein